MLELGEKIERELDNKTLLGYGKTPTPCNPNSKAALRWRATPGRGAALFLYFCSVLSEKTVKYDFRTFAHFRAKRSWNTNLGVTDIFDQNRRFNLRYSNLLCSAQDTVS